jgi:hypothetical protein
MSFPGFLLSLASLSSSIGVGGYVR